MTLTTNARLAGTAYLAYLVFGIGGMAIGTAGASAVSGVMTSFCALVLGVTLYAITREQDRDLAMIAMLCRVLEAVPGQGEIYFAVGNAIFCWLLLKARRRTRDARPGVIGGIVVARAAADRWPLGRPHGVVVAGDMVRVAAGPGLRAGVCVLAAEQVGLACVQAACPLASRCHTNPGRSP